MYTFLLFSGTLMQAYSHYQAGRTARFIGDLGSQVAAREGRIAELAGEYEARLVTEKGEKVLARQRALFGKQEVRGRTPMLVAEETALNLERDAEIARIRGRIGGVSARIRGIGAKFKGESLYAAGITKAAGSLLSGASDYYLYKNTPSTRPTPQPSSQRGGAIWTNPDIYAEDL